MKAAYKLNQDAIVYNPGRFEEILRRVLGKDDANSVINSIFEEIIKEAGFTLIGSNSNKR
jgi:chorismate mutase